MARRSLTHASSHINVMHQKSYFKEEIGIKDSLIHHKASNLINSFMFIYVTSVNMWDNDDHQGSNWSKMSEL